MNKIECIQKMRKLQEQIDEQKKMIERMVKQLHRIANITIHIEED